ncbi:hypothetical protein Rhopal_006853-T1 [Rhodotorula paludigena]|uniref:Protein-S-isoprenylcysteine O-methyltransferase n=1 Tax=Rhodotorula paludigena TaxID=86838 RepID=A0AAV5GWE0_9BASI|nr:hypothetical protein Rhopal_006853-T1 [Rhodotorula paludigena]
MIPTVLITLASCALLHAAYAAWQVRMEARAAGIQLVKSAFGSPMPAEVVVEALSALATLVVGLLWSAPALKGISFASEMSTRSIDSTDSNLAFANLRHRGSILFKEERRTLKQRTIHSQLAVNMSGIDWEDQNGIEYTLVLDRFYLGISAVIAVPLQAIFLSSAYAFKEPGVLVPGAMATVHALLHVVMWLGSPLDMWARNFTAYAVLAAWSLHNFILAIVHHAKARRHGLAWAQKLSPLVIVAYLLFPWVFLLPFFLVCSPEATFGNMPLSVFRKFGYATDIIGIILGAIAIIIEYFAHYTRLQHDLKPAAYADRHGRPSTSELVLSKGIYHISRHPHLFSYPLLALGIYFLCATPAFFAPYPEYRYPHALAAPAAKALVASVGAPVAIGVAAVWVVLPWLEQRQQGYYSAVAAEHAAVPAAEGNVWTTYEIYRSRTSPVVPLPPALYARLPRGVQRWVLFETPLEKQQPGAYGHETISA